MGQDRQMRCVARLMDRYGLLFSNEVCIDLTQENPASLFRWLTASLLLSARISHKVAMNAARALAAAGLVTAQRMAESAWKDRVAILNGAGYGRYDESTARMLGDTALLVMRLYDGDLRKLRETAHRDPETERAALKDCKGIGDVGADIFFREMQAVWPEHYPFADTKACAAAKRFGLPHTAKGLSTLVDQARYPTLIAALVRVELAGVSPADVCPP